MKVVIAVSCVLLAVSTAPGQFIVNRADRSVLVSATNEGQRDFQLIEAPNDTDPWTTDASAGINEPGKNYARAWHESRWSESEVVLSGGVLSFGPGPAMASSSMSGYLNVANQPLTARIVGELSVGPWPPDSTWTGIAEIRLTPAGGAPLIWAHAIAHNNAQFELSEHFRVDPDGIARASLNQEFSFDPFGSYEFDLNSGISCIAAGCEGIPIEYSARIIVVPEPTTCYLLAAALIGLFAVNRRYSSAHFGK